MKKGVDELLVALKRREKLVVMLAPSFVVEFEYPKLINQLKERGFDKIVEVTFGAKMINREYHKTLKTSKNLIISSVCPGIVEVINNKFPEYKKNLAEIDSPMTAMAKICKKTYPKHKVVFISPCNFKKIEAEKSKNINFIVNYQELKSLLKRKNSNRKSSFDKFYNDYTKIYPVSGGLSKTAHLKGILKKKEFKSIDGVKNFQQFLNHPDKKIKFLDVTFCKGGCIGGPCISPKLSLKDRKKRILKYLDIAKHENIPKFEEGLVKRAEGISFLKR